MIDPGDTSRLDRFVRSGFDILQWSGSIHHRLSSFVLLLLWPELCSQSRCSCSPSGSGWRWFMREKMEKKIGQCKREEKMWSVRSMVGFLPHIHDPVRNKMTCRLQPAGKQPSLTILILSWLLRELGSLCALLLPIPPVNTFPKPSWLVRQFALPCPG